MKASLLIAVLAMAGCSENESGLVDTAANVSQQQIPTLEELSVEMSLSQTQLAALAPSLTELRDAAAATPRDLQQTYEALLGFVEQSGQTLTTPQFVTLTGVLGERLISETTEGQPRQRRAFRQRRPGGPGGGRGPMGMLDQLDLSEEQQTKIDAWMAEQRAQMQALREQADGDREAMRERMEEHRQQLHAMLEEVLTAEQLAALEGLRDQHLETRHARMEDRHQRHAELLTTVLQLNEQQTAQLQQLFADQKARAQELRAGEGERSQIREQLQALRAETATAIRALLDEDQAMRFDALQSLREHMRPRWRGMPRG